MAKKKAAYKRIVLKLSGEGLAGPEGHGIGGDALAAVTRELAEVRKLGTQVGIVVGGGNMLRGSAFAEKVAIPPATAHYMGMLATVINALALQEVFESAGLPARAMSALNVPAACESYARRACLEHLEAGRMVILAGGTGRPFVTTDTAAALAAVELGADALIKATQVDGVYDSDPKKNPKAKRYPSLTFDRAINERLAVMDLSAIDLCQRGDVPIIVFSLHVKGNIARVVRGEDVGTIVSAKG